MSNATAPLGDAARRQFVVATQRAAGVIAARDRGDSADAAKLLGEFENESERMLAFYTCAELALKMLATTTGETIAEAASSLALSIDSAG